MGNFKDRDNRGGSGFRGGNSGGRPDFHKKSWGGNKGGNRDNVMHKATCSDCGNSCEVPFRPSGDKPVYCSNCFGAKKENSGERGSRKDFGPRPSSRPEFKLAVQNDDTKRQLADISMKLDRLIGAIEKFNAPKLEKKVEKMASEKPIVKKAVKVSKVANKKVATSKKK